MHDFGTKVFATESSVLVPRIQRCHLGKYLTSDEDVCRWLDAPTGTGGCAQGTKVELRVSSALSHRLYTEVALPVTTCVLAHLP